MTEYEKNSGPLSAVEARRLIHELRMYKADLEMQNMQLRDSRRDADKAKRRYLELYDSAPVAYLTVSPDGTIRESNLFGGIIFGRRRDLLIGVRMGILIRDEDRTPFADFLAAVFGGHRTSKVFALDVSGPNRRYIEVTGDFLNESDGGRLIIVDITARLALQSELEQSQRMESVGRLAGGVAHDFNNLLTVINGYSGVLESQLPAGSAQLASCRQISVAGARAAALTRQLLAFSRKQSTHRQVLDLNALVREVSRMLKRLIGEDVNVSLELQPDLVHVEADPGQLEQALINLAVNARDAMPNGGNFTIRTENVSISGSELALHQGLSEGPHARLTVSDTGHGMREDVRNRIFEPFFTTKAEGKGTGLGLSMLYGFVRQSGGSISVESELGLGAHFSMWFPAATVALETAAPHAGIADGAGGTETILLVEDEIAVRALVREVLTLDGYVVIDAEDGPAGILLAAEHSGRIDLLLTDVVMPKMGGRQLAETLAASWPKVKILFMSGYLDDDVMRNGVNASKNALLHKPFSPMELSNRVREVLNQVS